MHTTRSTLASSSASTRAPVRAVAGRSAARPWASALVPGLLVSLLGLSACTVTACSSGDGSSSGGTTSGGTTSGGTPVPSTCAAIPAGAVGTTHSGDVDAAEVWTAAGSPHFVAQNVTIRGGATLTIEPCAEVRVAEGKHIQVAFPGTPNTGTLVAEGAEDKPIRVLGMEKNGAAERWASIEVHAPGTARLAWVELEGGGGGDFEQGTTISAVGDGEDGADAILRLDHVTVSGSLGTGVSMTRGAAFAAGSQALVVKGSGNGLATAPYPVEIEEHALDSMPTGTFTGNAKDEILVDPRGGRTAGTGLLADTTIHDRGVPYHVGRSDQTSLNIGGRADDKLVTLTIEPGVVLRFSKGSALKVQHFTNLEPSTAAIRALGTAAKPIVFTSASDAPAAGDWRGLWFGGVPDASDKLDHVRIEYAGYDCGCILNTCSAITQHEAAVILTAQPAGPFITNTVFSNVAGHGITQGFDGAFVDYRPTNVFEGVSGCAQTRPRNTNTSCPNPKPSCE